MRILRQEIFQAMSKFFISHILSIKVPKLRITFGNFGTGAEVCSFEKSVRDGDSEKAEMAVQHSLFEPCR
jgi:hypothetical protein